MYGSLTRENKAQFVTLKGIEEMINYYLRKIRKLDRELLANQVLLDNKRMKFLRKFGSRNENSGLSKAEFESDLDAINKLEDICEEISQKQVQTSEILEQNMDRLSK